MGQHIPEAKQTVLGLHVISAEAYEKSRAAPNEINIILTDLVHAELSEE